MELEIKRPEIQETSLVKDTDPFFLRDTEKRFQEVVPSRVPALILDPGGRIQYMTRSARYLLEYHPEQPLQTTFFSYVNPKNLYQIMRDIADMVCYGKSSANWLLRMKTGKNRWKWIKATVRNHLRENGGSIIITLYDVNDL